MLYFSNNRQYPDDVSGSRSVTSISYYENPAAILPDDEQGVLTSNLTNPTSPIIASSMGRKGLVVSGKGHVGGSDTARSVPVAMCNRAAPTIIHASTLSTISTQTDP